MPFLSIKLSFLVDLSIHAPLELREVKGTSNYLTKLSCNYPPEGQVPANAFLLLALLQKNIKKNFKNLLSSRKSNLQNLSLNSSSKYSLFFFGGGGREGHKKWKNRKKISCFCNDSFFALSNHLHKRKSYKKNPKL